MHLTSRLGERTLRRSVRHWSTDARSGMRGSVACCRVANVLCLLPYRHPSVWWSSFLTRSTRWVKYLSPLPLANVQPNLPTPSPQHGYFLGACANNHFLREFRLQKKAIWTFVTIYLRESCRPKYFFLFFKMNWGFTLRTTW